MTDFEWPNPLVPDLPRVELGATLAEWREMAVPGTICAWVGPEAGSRVRSNITVTVQRRPGRESDWAADRKALNGVLQAIPGIAFLGVDESTDEASRRFLVQYEFGDEERGQIRQVVLLASLVCGDVSDLVQITGTTAADDGPGDASSVLTAVSLAKITPRLPD